MLKVLFAENQLFGCYGVKLNLGTRLPCNGAIDLFKDVDGIV